MINRRHRCKLSVDGRGYMGLFRDRKSGLRRLCSDEVEAKAAD